MWKALRASKMKLYVITRQDLSPGQQAVQSAHALQEFNFEYPNLTKQWHSTSNTLALLACGSEAELEILALKAEYKAFPISRFREPDRNNELTAIALGPEGKSLVRGLSLTLCHKNDTV